MENTKQRIAEIIGEASMCWSEKPQGTFDSEKAEELTNEIMTHIKYPICSPMPDTKTTKEEKCNAEKNGVKCRPPCKTCYGGAIITPSTREEEWEQEFDKEAEIKDFIRSLITEERRLAQEETLRDIIKLTQSTNHFGAFKLFISENDVRQYAERKGLSITNLSKDNHE